MSSNLSPLPSGVRNFGFPYGSSASSSPAFGCSSSGILGSKLTSYTETLDINDGTLESISAMGVYQNKCHEELRWEDQQLGNKGGFGVGFSFPSFSGPSFSTSSSGLWTTSLPSFGPKSSPSLFGPSSSPAFASSSSLYSSSTWPLTSTPSNLFVHQESAFSKPLSTPNSIWGNSHGAPSISVTQPGPAFGPNKPYFSFPPTTTSCMTPQSTDQPSSVVPDKTSLVTINIRHMSNQRDNLERSSVMKHTTIHVYGNGQVSVELSGPALEGSLYEDKDGGLGIGPTASIQSNPPIPSTVSPNPFNPITPSFSFATVTAPLVSQPAHPFGHKSPFFNLSASATDSTSGPTLFSNYNTSTAFAPPQRSIFPASTNSSTSLFGQSSQPNGAQQFAHTTGATTYIPFGSPFGSHGGPFC